MNDEPTCKHGQLARSCEICELQAALDEAIASREAVWGDIRDEYAQAALAGMLACPGVRGSVDELVDEAFAFADAAMKRRENR